MGVSRCLNCNLNAVAACSTRSTVEFADVLQTFWHGSFGGVSVSQMPTPIGRWISSNGLSSLSKLSVVRLIIMTSVGVAHAMIH